MSGESFAPGGDRMTPTPYTSTGVIPLPPIHEFATVASILLCLLLCALAVFAVYLLYSIDQDEGPSGALHGGHKK